MIKIVGSLVLAFVLLSCNDTDDLKVVKIDESKPFTVAVKKDRSYYQAEKIVAHLKDMKVPAYIIEKGDEGNKWYYVATGAFKSKEEAESFKAEFKEKYNLKIDSVLSYSDFTQEEKQNLAEGVPPRQEMKKIPAENPDVPNAVLETVEMVPLSNAFYIGQMSLLNFTQGHYKDIVDLKLSLDLPRGVSLWFLNSYGFAFSEVVLTDNLYGDRVTLDILRLKNDEGVGSLSSEIADKILATGEYEIEEKKPVSIKAYVPLSGYVVTILTKGTKKSAGKKRDYYVLVDADYQYLFIVQSVEKDDEILRRLIAEIGKSEGLKDYSEFWNSFYLIPQNLEGDVFLGYSTARLGWDYVHSKGDSKWARRMLYHWEYAMHFYAPGKGLWKYAAFDLNTDSYRKNTWYHYSDQLGNVPKRNFCGTLGHYVGGWGGNEVNYPFDRYILVASSYSGLGEQDLICRAEKFQYVCKR